MPPLDWGVFLQLPGGPAYNFELLCRGIIWRDFSRYGRFAARANQPGVEFHLQLESDCALGRPGRWYGWQCRWYDIQPGRQIGTTRRNSVIETIRITERELPGITDWVLWTRRPLASGDQDWFYDLQTDMRLHLWCQDHVDDLLTGEAEILRSTYFGDLVLTPEMLERQHQISTASVRHRWLPDVHQVVEAERVTRRMLGSASEWVILRELSDRLQAEASTLDNLLEGFSDSEIEAATCICESATLLAEYASVAYDILLSGGQQLLLQQLALRPQELSAEQTNLIHQLRATNNASALLVTDTVSDHGHISDLLKVLEESMRERVVAINADAGCGKTQLAAQVTIDMADRPAGILLYGKVLQAGDSLDEFASRQIVLHGQPVPSMEALICALDAAGARSNCRLPIVIDGLNEAEDPRDWRRLLANLKEILANYPNVLFICTLRPSFKAEALPDGLTELEMRGFGQNVAQAVSEYFEYYLIDATGADIPWGLLRHPLTLRLFCEVTNPERERVVGIENFPGSLTEIFDRYLRQAATRIMELSPREYRYYEQDVRYALNEFGYTLWQQDSRFLDETEFRNSIGDEVRPWNGSLLRALEDEGILFREPGDTPGRRHVAAAYDALGGHLVATALIDRLGSDGLEVWLGDNRNNDLLAGDIQFRHPLATDIVRSLAALIPRRLNRRQLWQMASEPLRGKALRLAADLEGNFLDADTVEQLENIAVNSTDLFGRLFYTRAVVSHPLNSEFLDKVLCQLGVAERDVRWTEWVRGQSEAILEDLKRLEEQWRANGSRDSSARLRAVWAMWLLTSTNRLIRDHATRALYWYGRGIPTELFHLTIDSLALSDPYVFERMLAASYGVVMAHQISNQEFGGALSEYLMSLGQALGNPDGRYPTNDWFARLCVTGTLGLARKYHAEFVPPEIAEGDFVFAPGHPIEPIGSEDPQAEEVNRTFHMDFENYTVGRLIENRLPYHNENASYQEALAYIRGTVWSLGWRDDELGAIDNDIFSRYYRDEEARVERYGKKYGWIGFYYYAGILDERGQLPRDERLSDVHIDPSFPDTPAVAPIDVPAWSRPTPADDRRWIRHGIIDMPDQLIYTADLGEFHGPWIAVAGHLEAREVAHGRRVFGLLSAFLVNRCEANQLADALRGREFPGNWWYPTAPSDYYTFAGEIPWSEEFAREAPPGESTARYSREVEISDGSAIDVEILEHEYAWESYHSPLNSAGGSYVPSKLFSEWHDLRGLGQTFNQVLPDSSVAAVSLSAPTGFSGHLLYLREDLVHEYAAGRSLIWFFWGERQLFPMPHPAPRWYERAVREHAVVWRSVHCVEEMSTLFRNESD